MSESSSRMTVPGNPPSDSAVADRIGNKAHKYRRCVTQLIEQRYPSVFAPEWLFGGKKHGWSLRYRKSKSLCTLIPEKNRFALLIVLGREARVKVEAIRSNRARHTQKKYDEATTYHDGKWLVLTVSSNAVVEDVMRLLGVKRKPQNDSDA